MRILASNRNIALLETFKLSYENVEMTLAQAKREGRVLIALHGHDHGHDKDGIVCFPDGTTMPRLDMSENDDRRPGQRYLELTIDLHNPYGDKRQRYDWTALPIIPKGSRFRDNGQDDDRLRCATNIEGRSSGFPSPELDALIRKHLVVVEPTHREWANEQGLVPVDVFYRAMEKGLLTREQVAAIDAELSAEGKYK